MTSETLLIKHMVCPRCIKVVTDELQALNLEIVDVTLGRAVFHNPHNVDQSTIISVIEKNGFELVRNNDEALTELIRVTVIRWLRETDFRARFKTLNECLTASTGKTYNHLSSHFSQQRKQTIEKFLIAQKIEFAKELIEYGELSFTEIADYLGYKALQHLSTQFKTETGMTMGQYKDSVQQRKNISDI